MRKVLIAICLSLAAILAIVPVSAEGKEADVYVIPIKEDVTKGLTKYLDRAINEAEEAKADVIIFDMNTPGGAVDAAMDIGSRILNTDKDIKTVTYIDSRALSAGSYIALHTDEIYMTPNATMGASAIINQDGNTAGKKAESMWIAAMEGAAKQKGRDPEIAKAMAIGDVSLPKLKKEGDLLTLDADNALKVGYSKGTIKNMDELLATLGYEGSDYQTVSSTFAESLAKLVTNPVVVPILLSVASLGLVVELYTPGFGVAGGMGLTALLLFFYGHYIAGLAGYESMILFVLGLILIVAEFFLPGGIAGLLGAVAIIGSIIMAGQNTAYMAISVIIALFLAVVAIIIMIKVFGKRMKFFKKLILTDSTNTESGYVSNVNRLDLIGREGIALTDLRPSGTVVVDDERLDVVAESSYIEAKTKVKIIKAEGSRIVVRKI
ncbi:nodulation protein NfeD [Lederbergia sp. NSJ-179]|uniref:NfeD family protein n=1 Tax=Lederbergia sp. NSJ-179 TaxID=2931402 RepID=UPI001FD0152C|nr:nodulation protein NfeD [Lederbergia sp. NSJ-179]MCJ7841838.1 nodulation protein NfeD [Lederbergia sp. NSJ-179]